MKTVKYYRTSFLLALGAMLAETAHGSERKSHPTGGSLAQNLQPLLDRHIIAGTVILVANKGRVLDLESLGYSDLETRTPMALNSVGWNSAFNRPAIEKYGR